MGAGRPARPFFMGSSSLQPGMKSPWLLALRLITFSLVAGIVVGWLRFPSYLRTPFLSYGIITLAFLLTLMASRRVNLNFLYRFLIALQFAIEILNEVGIVYSTGSLYSPFSVLFLLTIVSAALVYRLVGTLLVASLVSISYTIVTWINAYLPARGGNILPWFKDEIFSADDILFYSTFLHILVFYLVAFIAGYLAQKLQSKDRELHSASTELKKARLETGDILRHLNCGLVTIDARGDVVYFNRTAEAILGLTETSVAGRNCRDVFRDGLAPLADNLMSVLASQKLILRSEMDITTRQGAALPIGISTSVLYDDDFGVRGVIAIFQDLTETKRMDEKIRQADRLAAVGELSACIAHEIRNPLASISGSVEVLKNDLALSGDNEKLMSLILKESARLNNILSDFLLYARIGRSQFRKVEVNRIISDVIELVRRHPSFRRNIEIELNAEQRITYISGDEDQLKQLLLNLAVNACEAIGEARGLIQFEVITGAGVDSRTAVWLIVRDTGCGIPSDVMDKIFLPFYSTKKGGTGLGLSIVSRLVEAMEGRIEVISRPSLGTEFRLCFRALTDDMVIQKPQTLSEVTLSQ